MYILRPRWSYTPIGLQSVAKQSEHTLILEYMGYAIHVRTSINTHTHIILTNILTIICTYYVWCQNWGMPTGGSILICYGLKIRYEYNVLLYSKFIWRKYLSAFIRVYVWCDDMPLNFHSHLMRQIWLFLLKFIRLKLIKFNIDSGLNHKKTMQMYYWHLIGYQIVVNEENW